jgi:hypothetical protein
MDSISELPESWIFTSTLLTQALVASSFFEVYTLDIRYLIY